MQPEQFEFWIDLNLPPEMAAWISDGFKVKAKSFKDLNFDSISDIEVYKIAARSSTTIIITTKDIDFIDFQNSIGTPPKILYINVGNITNQNLKLLNQDKFLEILDLFLQTNKTLIEISTL